MHVPVFLDRLSLNMAALGLFAMDTWSIWKPVLHFILIVGLIAPTVVVCAIFTRLCGNHMRALLMSAGGAYIVWVCVPTVEGIRELPTVYDWYLDNLSWGLFPPIGAIVGGSIAWVIELAANRAASRACQKGASANNKALGNNNSTRMDLLSDRQERKNDDA
jgi:hypothetical protein